MDIIGCGVGKDVIVVLRIEDDGTQIAETMVRRGEGWVVAERELVGTVHDAGEGA